MGSTCAFPLFLSSSLSEPSERPVIDEFGERSFNAWLVNHPDLDVVLLNLRDGITVIRRKV